MNVMALRYGSRSTAVAGCYGWQWLLNTASIACVVFAATPPSASGQSYTWTGQALSANWDQVSFGVTNWVGNVVPTGSAATQLTFSSYANQGSPIQDLATPFLLNGITFGGVGFTLGESRQSNGRRQSGDHRLRLGNRAAECCEHVYRRHDD
jgi:hypothetical protein